MEINITLNPGDTLIVRGSDVKQPAIAKVIPIDGCRFHSSPEPDNQLESAPFIPPNKFTMGLLQRSLSEEMEAILEPRPWDDAKIAVNQHGKE